jgi:outer membrane cobalamin receptor
VTNYDQEYPLPQVSTAAITSFVDRNSIPLGAVDRIEILNHGGSATYGTDAIAGVVNLILKSDYKGRIFSIITGLAKEATTRPTTAIW